MSNVSNFTKEDVVKVLEDMATLASNRHKEKCPNATIPEVSSVQYDIGLNYLRVVSEITLAFIQGAGATKSDLYEMRQLMSKEIKKISDDILTDKFYSYEKNMK